MRKLKKGEVIKVSRILEDVGFKHYAEYLLTNRINKILQTVDKKEKIDKKSIAIVILGDIFAFLLQNMHKAEDNIDKLIMSYCEINKEQIEDMDIDEYISALKEIFMAGIPDAIKSIIPIDDIKKKMNSLNPEKN